MNVAVCIIVSSNAFPSPTSMIDSEGAWSVEDIIRWDELEKANVEVRSQLWSVVPRKQLTLLILEGGGTALLNGDKSKLKNIFGTPIVAKWIVRTYRVAVTHFLDRGRNVSADILTNLIAEHHQILPRSLINKAILSGMCGSIHSISLVVEVSCLLYKSPSARPNWICPLNRIVNFCACRVRIQIIWVILDCEKVREHVNLNCNCALFWRLGPPCATFGLNAVLFMTGDMVLFSAYHLSFGWKGARPPRDLRMGNCKRRHVWARLIATVVRGNTTYIPTWHRVRNLASRDKHFFQKSVNGHGASDVERLWHTSDSGGSYLSRANQGGLWRTNLHSFIVGKRILMVPHQEIFYQAPSSRHRNLVRWVLTESLQQLREEARWCLVNSEAGEKADGTDSYGFTHATLHPLILPTRIKNDNINP